MLGTLLLSVLLGAWDGGVKTLFSVLSWLIGWWCAQHFADWVMPWLPASLGNAQIRHGAGFVLVFVAVLLVLGLLSLLLTASLNAAGLNALNRMLGMLLGLARGVLIVLAVTWLAGLTALPQTELWKTSQLAPYLGKMALASKSWLPADWTRHLRY